MSHADHCVCADRRCASRLALERDTALAGARYLRGERDQLIAEIARLRALRNSLLVEMARVGAEVAGYRRDNLRLVEELAALQQATGGRR